MKNKKLFIILGIVFIVVGATVFVTCFLFLKKDSSDEKLSYGIVQKKLLAYDNLVKNSDCFIVEKDEKYGLLNSDFEVIVPLEYDGYDYRGNLFIFTLDEKTYLYNNKGELLEKEFDIGFFSCDISDACYFVNNNHFAFYDENGNLIYDSGKNLLGGVYLVDNYLFLSNKIINTRNDEEYNDFESVSLICDITYYFNDGRVWKLDKCNLELDVFESKAEYNKSLEKVSIEDTDYYMDYSYCSRNEAYLFKGDDLIIDECSTYFDISLAKKDVYVYNNGKNTVLFANGEKMSFDLISLVGDYIVVNNYLKDDDYYVYDVNGNEIKEWCLLESYKNGKYVCSDELKKYLVNENFEKISDGYDDIEFFSNYIIIKNNGKYAIYDNDFLTDFYYNSINTYDDYIVAYLGDGLEFIEFGYGKELIDGNEFIEEHAEIDTIKLLEIIKQYELDDIENIILDNKELFYKYSNLVIDNKNVKDYRKQVLNLFKIIVSNEKYIDKDYFFRMVKSLKIEEKETIYGAKVSGTYDYNTNSIILDDVNDRTLYHELIHFLDYSFNNDSKFYYCGNKYVVVNNINSYRYLNNEKCLRTYDYSVRWLVEAGAEYYAGKNYNNKLITSYLKDNYVFNAFMIIMGEEKVNEMFYSKDGNYIFYDFLSKNGYSSDEISEFNKALTALVNIDGDDVSNDVVVIYKYLTELYRKVHGSEWYSDKRMRYVISCLIDGVDELKDHNMLYVDGYYKPYDMFDFFGGAKSYTALSGIIIDGSKSFICVRGYDDVFGYYVIDYDFENNKVNSYDFYSYTSIYGIIN